MSHRTMVKPGRGRLVRSDMPRDLPIYLSAKQVLGKAMLVHTESGQLMDIIDHCEALLEMRGEPT